MALLPAGNDLTTRWSAHLAVQPLPKQEKERTILVANTTAVGAQDLTTLVRRLLDGKI